MLYVRRKCPIRPWRPVYRSCYRGTRYISLYLYGAWQASAGYPSKGLDWTHLDLGIQSCPTNNLHSSTNIIATADKPRKAEVLVTMDLIACAVVSMTEVLAAQRWSGAPGFMNTFLVLFTVQYLTVKYYRIFLYPLYFSPLRHLPGPTVRSPDTHNNIRLPCH